MTITATAFPFNDVDSSAAQFQSLFQQLQDDGILGIPSDNYGLVSAGSGYSVNVAAVPLAYVAGVVVTASAGTVTLDAPAASQPRIDLVVIRVNSSTHTAVIDKVTGVAGSGAPPALVQALGGVYEIPLAQIAVPAGAANIVAGNITDARLFVSKRLRQFTSATRPAANRGRFGFNHSTGKLETADGTGWDEVGTHPAWSDVQGKPTSFPMDVIESDDLFDDLNPGWTLNRGHYDKQGRLATGEFSVTRSGATLSGTNDGNVVNIAIGTFTAEARPNTPYAPLSESAGGVMRTGSVYHSGVAYITALLPGQDVVSGAEVTYGFAFITQS